jgi:starch synthase/alpha-amylase
VDGQHDIVEPPIRQELTNKWNVGCAYGILNAPDPSFNPTTDKNLHKKYTPQGHGTGKKINKRYLQKYLGLIQDEKAPLFFWPSRLDTIQKGCQLLADILYEMLSRYREQNLQIVFVANGEFQQHFRNIITWHHFENRVSICNFNEKLAREAYAASDFILMPSLFEPCGLPQMIGPIYGALPVANDTGGIHDTVVHMNVTENKGNGFLFNIYDSTGFLWAIEQAMQFYLLPQKTKATQIKRVMTESMETFNHAVTARHYMDLYEKMLQRPLVH